MRKLGPFFLVVFIMLVAAPHVVSAPASPVDVAIYDYADLSESTLHRFAIATEHILSGGQLSVHVTLCSGRSAPKCVARCESANRNVVALEIRVLPGNSPTNTHSSLPVLGEAFVNGAGGTYATVFLGAVKQQAQAAGIPWTVVLPYAAAHEIGHLLLGGDAHSSRGLMKAHWDRSDYQDMTQSSFTFTAEQVRRLAGMHPTHFPGVLAAIH